MTSHRPSLLVLLLGVTALVLTLACGGGEDESTPRQKAPSERLDSSSDTSSSDSEPQASATDELTRRQPPKSAPEGSDESPAQQLRRKAELPDDYPGDAPVYPGSEPSQVSRNEPGRMTVMFGTEDTPAEVMSYLEGSVPSAGWSVVAQQDMPTGRLLQARKGSRNLSVLLSVFDEGRDSQITMIAVSVDS